MKCLKRKRIHCRNKISFSVFFLVEYPLPLLTKGEQRYSKNRKFRLTFQLDGALVIDCGPCSNVLWKTPTGKTSANTLQQTVDGNLIITDSSNGIAQWSAETKGIDYFTLLDDGNFVGYKGQEIVWQTNTGNKCKRQYS